MANLTFEGLDEFALSMQEIAELPDETVYEMLDAEAEIVVAAQKRKIEELGLVKTGKLRDSIRAFHKRKGDEKFVSIYPYGKHGSYRRKIRTKTYKNSKHGRTYTVGGDAKETRNNELGFILEYGAPKRNIKGRQWMHLANEGAAAAAAEAAAAVYDRFLKSKNL